MHNTTTTHSSLETQLVGIRVVSYVAFVLFGLVFALATIVLVARLTTGKSATLQPLHTRQVLATALLACGWLFAGLNPLLVTTPVGVWSLARVLLNAMAWEWTLAQLTEYYYVLEPMRTAQPVRRAALVLLVLSAFGEPLVKFVALTGALPLAVLMVLCATLWSTARDRAIWPLTPVRGAHDFSSILRTGSVQIRFGMVLFALLALTGLWALVSEMLSAEYGGLLPMTASFALMLPEHAVLALMWFSTALAPAAQEQSVSEGRLRGDAAAAMLITTDAPLALDTVAENGDT